MEFQTFYRLTNNVIWLRTSQFFAQYQNLLKSLTKGIEAEFAYQPYNFLNLKFNATYQDIRNRSPKSVTQTVDNRYFNARLPNIPYLFANGEIRYNKNAFLGSKNKFSAWWTANYVHEYFLFWDVDGNKDFKNVIPSQLIQNIGISYTLPKNQRPRLQDRQNGTGMGTRYASENTFSSQDKSQGIKPTGGNKYSVSLEVTNVFQ